MYILSQELSIPVRAARARIAMCDAHPSPTDRGDVEQVCRRSPAALPLPRYTVTRPGEEGAACAPGPGRGAPETNAVTCPRVSLTRCAAGCCEDACLHVRARQVVRTVRLMARARHCRVESRAVFVASQDVSQASSLWNVTRSPGRIRVRARRRGAIYPADGIVPDAVMWRC